jgi:teichuronic acid biosynthesis glycosyltransferase TuaC
MMRILTFSTLYPSEAQPTHGIFVETRLRFLRDSGRVEPRVLAPVPWFPSASKLFGRYAAYAKAPRHETRHGILIDHPRYPVIPKLGVNLAPFSLYQAAARAARAMLRDGYDFDLIDAHFFFPDGIAAVMLGRALGKPVTITARGTDLNFMPRYAVPRRMIRWAADQADGLITVAAALKDVLLELGVPPEKVTVLRNGVDLELFRPGNRQADRQALGLAAPTLLSVGHLIERKGHHLIIDAVAELPGTELLIAGSGPEEAALKARAASRGVEGRVRFLGALPQSRLPQLYRAADALVLASSREGWANVLLESMACGTPVVATPVWGTPEVVNCRAAGCLAAERSAPALAYAIRDVLSAPSDRAATRAHAESFDWQATTDGQLRLFSTIIERRARRSAPSVYPAASVSGS